MQCWRKWAHAYKESLLFFFVINSLPRVHLLVVFCFALTSLFSLFAACSPSDLMIESCMNESEGLNGGWGGISIEGFNLFYRIERTEERRESS